MALRVIGDISIEEVWAKILPNLELLFDRQIQNNINYMQLHSNVVNYCCSNLNPNSEVQKTGSGKDIGCENNGGLLYFKLKEYLTSYCNDLIQKSADLTDEDLLRFYVTEWDLYVRNSKFLNGTFAYLNRYWVERKLLQINENPESVHKVGKMAVFTWKNTIFQTYDTRIVNIVVKMINRQRQGDIIDTAIIQRTTSSYVIIGMYVYSKNSKLILYQEHFEKQLLAKSHNFYVIESLAVLKDNPVTVYLKWVDKRLSEEAYKVAMCVDLSSQYQLLKAVERSLIQNHLDLLVVEFQELLKLDKSDDMKLLFSLVSRNPEDLDKFIEAFQKHVHSEGLYYIEKCGEAVKSDSHMFMDAILNVYNKYLNLVLTVFDNDLRFKEAFDTACKDFVNLNFTSSAPDNSRKPSELLAKYCDNLLKQSNASKNEDMDKAQEDVRIVFKFILDKDVFQTCYMKSLARRLMNQTSYDGDCESDMILKLKSDIGAPFTNKIERMLSDVRVSMDISKEFDQSDTKEHNLDFNVMVLQFGSWPLYKSITYTLPSELQKCISGFTIFFTSKCAGKKLNWMHGLSKGEVVTTNFKKRYIFESSNMEITILMLFNTSTTLSLAQIHEQSAIQMESIKQIVEILLKAKIVTSCTNLESLTPDTMVSVNKSYNNKKLRVNINLPIKEEVQREQVISDRNIDEERRYAIQATIVRIMKARKSLKHSELISEVVQSLSGHFQPNIPGIKKSIELLIQKDYIKRDGTLEVYTYVA